MGSAAGKLRIRCRCGPRIISLAKQGISDGKKLHGIAVTLMQRPLN